MLIPAFESRPTLLDDDVVTVIGVRVVDDAPQLVPPDGASLEGLGEQLVALGVTGKAGSLVRALVPVDGRLARVALAGLGSAAADDEHDRSAWVSAMGSAARSLHEEPAVAIAAPGVDAEAAEALVTAFVLGGYRFDNYRTEPRPATERLVLVAPGDADVSSGLERARIIASAVSLVRDLVNTPANDLGPSELAGLARSTAVELGVEVEVLDERALHAGGYGGHLAVGRGSVRPPRLVVLRWRPAGASAHVALVGKGITFDTGGLSLKPAASMVGMKFDMAGAAVVLGVVCALAQLGVPVEATGYLCLAENMPSGDATRPDDIIAIHGGRTVEVTNTDAEGRLVLADALAAASELGPDAIIDIATLTGAQIIALGERTTGVMGNDDEWIQRVTTAAGDVGEPAWHMPIPADAGTPLKSEVADVANARPGNRAAGMLSAAWFLQSFVGEDASGSAIPWVHLDIAGPANNDRSAYGVTPKGATGVMTRTLIRTLEALAAGASPGSRDASFAG